MKRAFTIVEISILAVILLIVGCLVVPFSLDDTRQASYVLEWRALQDRITMAFTAAKIHGDTSHQNIEEFILKSISDSEYKKISPYKIKYMNGHAATGIGNFQNVYEVGDGNTIGFRWNDSESENIGIMFYDINGKSSPNRWGKDVFGININSQKIEPLCKDKDHKEIVQDCSKNGTGCCCSYYYLVGGNF